MDVKSKSFLRELMMGLDFQLFCPIKIESVGARDEKLLEGVDDQTDFPSVLSYWQNRVITLKLDNDI